MTKDIKTKERMMDVNTPEMIMRALLREEGNEPCWWWLSFADGDLPKGEQFLGVAVIQAQGMAFATQKTHLMGINPGGEVLGYPVPDVFTVPEKYADRLLTKAEAEELDAIFGEQRK